MLMNLALLKTRYIMLPSCEDCSILPSFVLTVLACDGEMDRNAIAHAALWHAVESQWWWWWL